jgi:hypothetical protein
MTKEEEDGVEIMVEPDGTKLWFLHKVLHRDDGPAIEFSNGNKEWYSFGNLHREDGPAVEYRSGTKEWWRDGKQHREDGPAVEYADGRIEFYLNGEEWEDGASVLARQKAEKDRPKKRPLCPRPFKKP